MGAEFENLHQILRNLYTEMLPLCGDIIGVAKGVAGLGALFYIAAKVWQALARAEPIDVYPLLRPFAIGLCIMFFPTFVLGTINAVMSPVVKGCNNILQGQTLDIEKYSQQRDKLEYEAMVRNPETAYLVSDKEFDKRIKELGWSPKSMGTMLAMQVKKAGYGNEEVYLGCVPLGNGTVISSGITDIGHYTDIFSDCIVDSRPARLCNIYL